MQKALGYHSFEAIIIAVNGVQIGNFTEDGGVSYERGAQPRDSMAGADGFSTMFKISDERLMVTISVMETSASYPYLWALYAASRAQEALNLRPLAMTYSHINPISGETVTSGEAHFLEVAVANAARAPGTRDFKILLPYAADTMTPGLLNAATALPFNL